MTRVPSATPRGRPNLPLALVLAFSLALNSIPLWWGLPSWYGWAFDEILPSDVFRASRHLLDGWADRYPPLHYYLLWSIWRPFLAALDAAGVVTDPGEARLWLFLLGRSLSVLMATAAVYLVYRTSRLASDRPTSTLAALTCAVVAPFVYYAKTMNLEAPYLFWFAFSLWFLVRVLRHERLRDTLALGATTAFAICSKDQAFALYLAVPPLLVASRWRRERTTNPGAPLWRAALHPHLLAGGLLALALFGVVHRIPLDPGALASHVAEMRRISAPAVEFAPTVSGHLLLLVQSLRNTAFAMSPPLLAVCLAGVVGALRRSPGSWRHPALLLMAVSYYVGFVALVRYSYDRFLLPVAILLALCGAPALRALDGWRLRGRPAGRAIVVAILGFAALRAAAVDAAMLFDSRYAAERWLAREGSAKVRVVVTERDRPLGLRRLEAMSWVDVRRSLARTAPALDADHLVVVAPGGLRPRLRRIYAELASGRAGYREVARFEPGPWWRLLDRRGARTNLDKVDPEVVIFRREPSAE